MLYHIPHEDIDIASPRVWLNSTGISLSA